jgi:hypothetical protein
MRCSASRKRNEGTLFGTPKEDRLAGAAPLAAEHPIEEVSFDPCVPTQAKTVTSVKLRTNICDAALSYRRFAGRITPPKKRAQPSLEW